MEEYPPLPRKRKGHSYPVGPGIFWWKEWKVNYHDEGGILGYANWIDAMRDLQRTRRKPVRK